MHIRRSTWQSTVLTVLAVFSMSIWTVAPAVAASAKGHAGVTSTHKAAKATRCAKRNKASGTIKYSDWQFPDTLNTYQTGASVSYETIVSFLEGLTVPYNNTGKVQPLLLKGLPKGTNGGKTFTGTLRPGALWSDGREITAKDAVFGWKVENDPDSGPYCAASCDVISRIDTKGKYGLVFHLKRAYAPFNTVALANMQPWPTSWKSAWSNGDVKAAVKKLFQDPTFNFENATDYPTNGAYQVESFSQNDRIVLKPNPRYTNMTCGAHVATLIFAFYASKPGLIAAAASHATDNSTNYTPADVKDLNSHKSQFSTSVKPAYQFEHVLFNIDKTYRGQPNPVSNAKVRLALALALDKYGLVQSALGFTRKQASQLIAWSSLITTPTFKQPFADTKLNGQWDPIAKKYTVDTGTGQALAHAKTLLAQAGHPGGNFSVDGFTTTGNPVRQAEFSVIQSSWAKIGVKFVPNYIPASKLFSDYAKGAPGHTGDFQAEMYTSVGSQDPDVQSSSVVSRFCDRNGKTVHSAINMNDGCINDKIIDTAMKNGAGTLNSKERQKWYSIFQRRMNQQAYYIDLYYRTQIDTTDGRIQNFKPQGFTPYAAWNSWQWVSKGSS